MEHRIGQNSGLMAKATLGQVQFGSASDILADLLRSNAFSSLHILCDTNTRDLCLPGLIVNFDPKHVVTIPAGEAHKTLDTCVGVWKQLLAQGADRSSLVVNLGGGVVTDLGGFCAASFMRGTPFVHIPTTVLGMTDAAIGGKTGVDFESFKNYIGFFAEPLKVIVDTAFIETLDMRQRRNGLAEVIKHGFIHDPGLLELVVQSGKIEEMNWDSILRRSVQTKLNLIADDKYDRGIRAALNFGHTIGHAIESFSLIVDEPLHHGEAIALGMLVESRLSSALVGLSEAEVQTIDRVINTYFNEVAFPRMSLDQLHGLILKDKKKQGGDVLYSLISALGEPAIGQKVPETAVNEAYLHYAKR
jgi:3-dehydroquinate synthase